MEKIPARIQECGFLTFISVGLAWKHTSDGLQSCVLTGPSLLWAEKIIFAHHLREEERRKVLMGLWEFPNIKSWEYTVYIFVCAAL